MIRPIVTDNIILSKKSSPAAKTDMPVVKDLMDTIQANAYRCVGMAANMIGVNKRIIVVLERGLFIPMINPRIVGRSSQVYETEEGCLCHAGTQTVTRHETVTVEFLDLGWKKQRRTYNGYTAQIIQHEMDHCNGILI